VRVNRSDLKSRQISQVDDDLTPTGGRGPTERDVSRLDEGEEASGDTQLASGYLGRTCAIAKCRQQQPDERPALNSLSHGASPSSVWTGC